QLDQVLDLLNTRSGDRYVFSGRAVDQPTTDSMAHILDGDTTHAGFNQIVSERNQADLGASGLGRLLIPALPPAGTVVTIGEDVAGSPFGFKLAAVNSTLTNATLTRPSGSPPRLSLHQTARHPQPGRTLQ